MAYTYLGIVFGVFLLSFLLDFFVVHLSKKYLAKLLLTLSILAGVGFFLDYAGVNLHLWAYDGLGIIGVYFLSLPLEEYLFLLIAPYAAIVFWEFLHLKVFRTHK